MVGNLARAGDGRSMQSAKRARRRVHCGAGADGPQRSVSQRCLVLFSQPLANPSVVCAHENRTANKNIGEQPGKTYAQDRVRRDGQRPRADLLRTIVEVSSQ